LKIINKSMEVSKKKVYVGLSGGVDSSVSALLLKQQGYDVTGVYIKGWQPDWIPCTWKDDRISALRTAAHLDIPFITLDLEQKYKQKVVNYILEEYAKGNTPNPDMLCNREIKFGEFLKWSLEMGAEYVATGHYSVVQDVQLIESADKEKDQSYFLSQLTQKELKHILFPIGHLQKSEVRKIAEVNNLPVATRKDSQGICFVGDLEMKDFLKRELNPQKGKVVNENGEEIGEHDGAILYTIGERHGFKINKKEGDENIHKYYVVAKDINSNTIVVSSSNIPGTRIHSCPSVLPISDRSTKGQSSITLRNLSSTNNLDDTLKSTNLAIRIRYRGIKIPVEVKNYENGYLSLQTKNGESVAYAPGQFGVLYEGEKVLGGGELC